MSKVKKMQSGNDFRYEVTEEIAVLEERDGWTLELNAISFNGRSPRPDLRRWSPEGKMGKGITLSDTAFTALVTLIKEKY